MVAGVDESMRGAVALAVSVALAAGVTAAAANGLAAYSSGSAAIS